MPKPSRAPTIVARPRTPCGPVTRRSKAGRSRRLRRRPLRGGRITPAAVRALKPYASCRPGSRDRRGEPRRPRARIPGRPRRPCPSRATLPAVTPACRPEDRPASAGEIATLPAAWIDARDVGAPLRLGRWPHGLARRVRSDVREASRIRRPGGNSSTTRSRTGNRTACLSGKGTSIGRPRGSRSGLPRGVAPGVGQQLGVRDHPGRVLAPARGGELLAADPAQPAPLPAGELGLAHRRRELGRGVPVAQRLLLGQEPLDPVEPSTICRRSSIAMPSGCCPFLPAPG